METFVIIVLLTLLATTVIGIARTRDLVSVIVLSSIFSFLMATTLVILDAVDVAMTEAAVGAGMSTVLFLSALYLTRVDEAPTRRGVVLPLFVAGVTAAVLLAATSGLPPFGAADTPVQAAGPDYMGRSIAETGIANVVSAVLASYRGFDTLGETVVIFVAGIGVLLLLSRPARRRRDDADGGKG